MNVPLINQLQEIRITTLNRKIHVKWAVFNRIGILITFLLFLPALIGASGFAVAQDPPKPGIATAWGNEVISAEKNEGFTKIALGRNHNLALRNDGTLVAWGMNSFGRSTVPDDLTDVADMATGVDFNLVLLSDGTLAG